MVALNPVEGAQLYVPPTPAPLALSVVPVPVEHIVEEGAAVMVGVGFELMVMVVSIV